MKKLLALSLALILCASCSLDNGNDTNYSFDILPVESVDIPSEFTLGETYPITVTYLRPTTCHYFREFYYAKNLNERTVAPITIEYNTEPGAMVNLPPRRPSKTSNVDKTPETKRLNDELDRFDLTLACRRNAEKGKIPPLHGSL